MSVPPEDELRAACLAELDTRDTDARLVNDHAALWICDCCPKTDNAIRIPVGVTVVHGGRRVQFDSWLGLQVDGRAVAQGMA